MGSLTESSNCEKATGRLDLFSFLARKLSCENNTCEKRLFKLVSGELYVKCWWWVVLCGHF